MRNNLKQFNDGNFHNFYGTFIEQRNTKDPCINRSSVALVINIKDSNDKILTDHTWIPFSLTKENKKIKKDDIIHFKARVDTYLKGYLGFNKKNHNDKDLQLDYQLTNIIILNNKE